MRPLLLSKGNIALQQEQGSPGSMRPLLISKGNLPRCACNLWVVLCFNEAFADQQRKRKPTPSLMSKLSGFNEAFADQQRKPGTGLHGRSPKRFASMRPLLISKGNRCGENLCGQRALGFNEA